MKMKKKHISTKLIKIKVADSIASYINKYKITANKSDENFRFWKINSVLNCC